MKKISTFFISLLLMVIGTMAAAEARISFQETGSLPALMQVIPLTDGVIKFSSDVRDPLSGSRVPSQSNLLVKIALPAGTKKVRLSGYFVSQRSLYDEQYGRLHFEDAQGTFIGDSYWDLRWIFNQITDGIVQVPSGEGGVLVIEIRDGNLDSYVSVTLNALSLLDAEGNEIERIVPMIGGEVYNTAGGSCL